ncbi:hypothetical protein JQ572_04390 [Bradyrhizobium japonicum]|nr:hypothetical protein [Bradyrhizobium japonicum]
MDQPPLEKPWPNEPKPPRLTLPEPESDDVPDEGWDEESLLKKLDRDDQRELPPLEELLLPHAVPACTGVSAPGTVAPGAIAPGTLAPAGPGSQCCRGISV